jgi:hypothetical protein
LSQVFEAAAQTIPTLYLNARNDIMLATPLSRPTVETRETNVRFRMRQNASVSIPANIEIYCGTRQQKAEKARTTLTPVKPRLCAGIELPYRQRQRTEKFTPYRFAHAPHSSPVLNHSETDDEERCYLRFQ